MAGVDSGDVTDDAAARRAAEVAVELTEASGPPHNKRISAKLHGVADRTTTAAAFVAASARRGADTAARRGAATARRGAAGARRGAGSASHGVGSGMNWLTAQVVAMGPRLRFRDQATLRAQFPGQSDDEIAQRLIDRAARAATAVGGADYSQVRATNKTERRPIFSRLFDAVAAPFQAGRLGPQIIRSPAGCCTASGERGIKTGLRHRPAVTFELVLPLLRFVLAVLWVDHQTRI